jgi:hypothetical protein
MNDYTQLVLPNLYVEDQAGFSLRHVQTCFGVPHKHSYAWVAWEATEHKHPMEDLPNAYVPVWFSSITSSSVMENFNQGHVLLWDPITQSLVGTPMSGYGQRSYTIDMVEKHSGGKTKYVGWSEDLNGLRIVKKELKLVLN